MIKTLALGVVVLFISVAVTPSIGIPNCIDDTTPPVTTISFNPPEPDGLNGWYVSNVTVTLNSTDDFSGVNITKYRIDYGIWFDYTEPFVLDYAGEDIQIEFYSVDYAGNQEEIKSASVNIDKTKPWISLSYEFTGGNSQVGWEITFIATATDDTSGMNRVEFYNNWVLQETINGSGPTYLWIIILPPSYPLYGLLVRGLIHNKEITDEYVKFYAIIVIISGLYLDYHFSAYAYDIAGNWYLDAIPDPSPPLSISPGIYLFSNLTIPSDYEGYIGKFFIRATFDI